MAEGVKVAWSPTEESELGLFSMLRDQLWWAVREWLRIDKGAMLPPSDKLKEELLVAKYIKINGRIKVTDKATMRELLGRSPDEADSLCLTFYNSQTGAFSSEYV